MKLPHLCSTLALWLFPLFLASQLSAQKAPAAEPLVIGETFTLKSAVLEETRRINVYKPNLHGDPEAADLPVLYMPDGGIQEDFLHVAGLVQVSVGNGTMRPFLLVGIENTQRRRDLTGTTSNLEDKKIAPVVGGSAAFRQFIKKELMPEIRKRYRTTNETAIVGESLAGLFIVETFFREPTLFDHYLAFDPSLWWNDEQWVKRAKKGLPTIGKKQKTLFLASSDQPEISASTRTLANSLAKHAPSNLVWHHQDLPQEHHHTIYHPAALQAFRTVLAPH